MHGWIWYNSHRLLYLIIKLPRPVLPFGQTGDGHIPTRLSLSSGQAGDGHNTNPLCAYGIMCSDEHLGVSLSRIALAPYFAGVSGTPDKVMV